MTTTVPLTTLYPIPADRGRWRITLHRRDFTYQNPLNLNQTIIGELVGARGRRLEQQLNTPAQVTFTLDSSSPIASSVLELGTEAVFWRWSETLGRDICMCRAVVDASEDQVTEQSAVVTFTGHDLTALLSRRIATSTLTYTQTDQDSIVFLLVNYAEQMDSSSGTSFRPGNLLKFQVRQINPDGTDRAAQSGQLRDRTYLGNQNIGQAIDDLAHVIDGFDYDSRAQYFDQGPAYGPGVGAVETLRVFFPSQGVARSDMALQYGSTVSAFTRTVSSSDYANYVRMLGNNQSSDPTVPQVFSEAWNQDANNVTVNPVGLWAAAENASDVTIQSTLDDQAQGYLDLNGILVPSYTLTMRAGAYRYGYPNMGDVVPFIAQVGRLNVNTTVRVVGIAYAIGEDGDETVELTVGRPATTLANLFSKSQSNIDALARR